MQNFTEPSANSVPARQAYADGMQAAIGLLRADAAARKRAWISPAQLAADPERYRAAYRDLLGIPTCERVFGAGAPAVTETPVGTDDLCTIARLVFTLAPGVCFTGLLLRPLHEPVDPMPLVITQHGGGGTPELCSDMVGKNNYNHMVRRVLARGATAFAPQLLLWNCGAQNNPGIPHFDPVYDRSKVNLSLRQCGTSIVGFEIYAISRALDYLLAHEPVRPDRCGMIGISYGGYYTLHAMAAEERITAGYSAAIFNDRLRYNWHDMVWRDSAAHFLDAEVAGLCAPRHLWIEVGKTDPVFDWTSIPAVFDEAQSYYDAQSVPDAIHLNLWDGGHTITDTDDGMDFLFAHI